MQKDLDLVVMGATGFTGRLVAEVLAAGDAAARGLGGLRWGLAGRDAGRLAAVRDAVGAPAGTPLLVADTSVPATLQALVQRTRLVLSTAGPYQVHGSGLVAACAAAGTDYVDLCGEPAWMRTMIEAHEAAARASGARLVFSCGFDSIPFDLGVQQLQQAFRARYGHPASRVRGRVRTMKGRFSGGTAASLKATLAAAAQDPRVRSWLRDPFALVPGFQGPPQPSGHQPGVDEALTGAAEEPVWVAPFVMAPINTKNVHRSNALLGHPWGADFVYDEMLVTGPGARGEQLAHQVAADRSLASDEGPKPGEGPSKAERDAGRYDLLFLGEDAAGHRLRLAVRGEGDPGYASTSRMVVQAAACLLGESAATPGGIWTPASALGDPLVARLQAHAGLSFTVED